METLTVRQARRLALARAGLLKPRWTGLPSKAAGRGKRARGAALSVIRRFGYLQLDSVSVAGARSHGLVLLSRLEGFDPALAEELLQPGEPLFEYWGHEASWLPLELYPVFEFRREEFHHHPWWGDLLGQHPEVAEGLLRRIEAEGPLRSLDLEGSSKGGWWNLETSKRVALALWSKGELAIRERKNFQRAFDLKERVIPEELRSRPVPRNEAVKTLLLRALAGHGWARTGTLSATWRFRNMGSEITTALHELEEAGEILSCQLLPKGGKGLSGWVRPRDLDLAHRLEPLRPRRDQGVLLSPFDPILWDRTRVQQLFGFEQVLEIFKPAPKRQYGYYCLPVLAGEHLVGRVDLKAQTREGRLEVLSRHLEPGAGSREEKAMAHALARYAVALGLNL
ncbi:MAG: YcaQ family DNA glycosylase [Acidobacteria bacterium]|nr:YcaQ family DNA glycosylase [Acidobacteriota bacterium]